MTSPKTSQLKLSLISAALITAALTLGSAFVCVHEYMPEQLSSHPGLYTSAFVLVP